MDIFYGTATKDHIPVAMSVLPAIASDGCLNTGKINWTSLTKDVSLMHFACTDEFLNNVNM